MDSIGLTSRPTRQLLQGEVGPSVVLCLEVVELLHCLLRLSIFLLSQVELSHHIDQLGNLWSPFQVLLES